METDVDEVLISDFGELFDGGRVAFTGIVCIHLAASSYTATAPKTGSRYLVKLLIKVPGKTVVTHMYFVINK